jgi:hypothetical protein
VVRSRIGPGDAKAVLLGLQEEAVQRRLSALLGADPRARPTAKARSPCWMERSMGHSLTTRNVMSGHALRHVRRVVPGAISWAATFYGSEASEGKPGKAYEACF